MLAGLACWAGGCSRRAAAAPHGSHRGQPQHNGTTQRSVPEGKQRAFSCLVGHRVFAHSRCGCHSRGQSVRSATRAVATRAVRRTLNLSDLVGPAVELCSAQCARIAAPMICHRRVTHTIHHKQLGFGGVTGNGRCLGIRIVSGLRIISIPI